MKLFEYPYTYAGKEVLRRGLHHADAVSEQAARVIAFSLNVVWSRDQDRAHCRRGEIW